MKSKIIAVILIILISFTLLSGCRNFAARTMGGTMELDLPPGEKLVTITWKDDDLWYLTRPMRDDEFAEEYKFQASTNWGVFEGTVIVREVSD